MTNPQPIILKYLKKQGRGIDLPLHVLRQFQEFEKTMNSAMKSYDHLPPTIAYAMRSFKIIEMFGISLIMSGDFPSAKCCYDDVINTFGKDNAFTDGITLPSWIFFNFPISPDGSTIATEILNQSPDLAGDLSLFVDSMSSSRLGLYEALGDGRHSCQLKELFTGKKITLEQSLGIPRGNISVIRVINLMGQCWAFGDTNEFPAEHRPTIEDMVTKKMFMYFQNSDLAKSYETMMRLAGPYWFSIFARDTDGYIFDPDHYLSYYDEENE